MLGLAPVRVINRVEHEVFVMPTEGGVAHADIEPGDVDAGDVMAPGELHQ